MLLAQKKAKTDSIRTYGGKRRRIGSGRKMKVLLLLLVCSFAVDSVLAELCPDQTRPHATRCDQYFRCVLLPSKTHVWIPTKCEKGKIYEPQLKTCVLPGDEWECNLSAEEGYESGENVYGINNLPAAIYTGPTVNPVRQTTPLGSIENDAGVSESSGEGVVDGGGGGVSVGGSSTEGVTDPVPATTIGQQQITNLPTVTGDNEGYYIILDGDGNNRTTIYHSQAPYEVEETEEFSGDGIIEDAKPTIGLNFEAEVEDKQSSAMLTSDENVELSKNDLNLFLADYTLQTSSEAPLHKKKKKHPLPPDGKIHPEHLTAILNQQKKLNRYASQIKRKGDPTGGIGDRSPFSDQPVFTSRPDGAVLFNVPQRVPEEPHAKAPFMSEDVIRSIIEISKQMMSNQKPSMEEMYVKPIFIPISVSSAAQDFTRLPEQPSKIMYHQLFPSLSNNSTRFIPKPIGITITNPYTLGHQATIYDNLRNQIMNDSQYYNYQTALVDSYGSRFPPQRVSNAPPMYPYPPPMAYPVYSQQNYQYPSNQPNFQYPNNQQNFQYHNPYYVPHVMNRLRNTAGYDNDNSQSNEVTTSDEENEASAELPEKEEPSTPIEQSSEEALEDSGTKKLISVGGHTLNYNDYKDSILPLLDANPDEVRISVLTCTLGSRQPNKTDCTKYYVCNPHNGAFQSFTCPSFTAFNSDTRVCDSATYKSCKTAKPTTTTPTPTTLSRFALNAHKPKPSNQDKINQYVDLITKQAFKILSRNKIPAEYPEPPENDGMIRITAPTMSSMLPSITVPTFPSSTKRLRTKPKRKHTKKRTSAKKPHRKSVRKSTTTPATATMTTTTTTTTEAPPKAPKCKKNGKMPDPAEKHNYYVCYKASPKKFIKTKMACPNNLVYCAGTEFCTFAKNCKN